MRFDGIIFDLDGTLWDTCQTVADSMSCTLKSCSGIERRFTYPEVRSVMGMAEKSLAERLFSCYGERSEELCHLCLQAVGDYIAAHGAKFYDGTAEMLELLSREARLFIVSNCQHGYAEVFLDLSGLGELFTEHLCEGDTGLPKAKNIRALIDGFGLKNPVYVGDTALDEASAAEADCPFIHAAYGYGSAASPLGSILSPMELPALLNTL